MLRSPQGGDAQAYERSHVPYGFRQHGSMVVEPDDVTRRRRAEERREVERVMSGVHGTPTTANEVAERRGEHQWRPSHSDATGQTGGGARAQGGRVKERAQKSAACALL